MSKTTVRVQLAHNTSIPGWRWCGPVGWLPTNVIEGAEYIDGAWWDEDDDEAAGIAWFGPLYAYGAEEVIEVDLDDLRVMSSGDCRVIGRVKL